MGEDPFIPFIPRSDSDGVRTCRKRYPFGTALSAGHSYYLFNTIRVALPATTRPSPSLQMVFVTARAIPPRGCALTSPFHVSNRARHLSSRPRHALHCAGMAVWSDCGAKFARSRVEWDRMAMRSTS